MKKLIAVLTLFLAFTINANAQDTKKVSTTSDSTLAAPETAAHMKGAKEAAELSEYLGLDQTMYEGFTNLFEQKNSILEQKDLAPERRAELSRVIEAKIRASLDGKQIEKLEKNPALLKKLVN